VNSAFRVGKTSVFLVCEIPLPTLWRQRGFGAGKSQQVKRRFSGPFLHYLFAKLPDAWICSPMFSNHCNIITDDDLALDARLIDSQRCLG
jgi:hypothetical protein